MEDFLVFCLSLFFVIVWVIDFFFFHFHNPTLSTSKTSIFIFDFGISCALFCSCFSFSRLRRFFVTPSSIYLAYYHHHTLLLNQLRPRQSKHWSEAAIMYVCTYVCKAFSSLSLTVLSHLSFLCIDPSLAERH